MQTGDKIRFEFPVELGLPQSPIIPCTSDISKIRELECSRSDTREVLIFFKKVFEFDPEESFSIIIPNVKNAGSTRPSSPFSTFLL